MKLQNYLTQRVQLVERALDGLLPTLNTEPRLLHEAMRYSVFAGGKRLRPILVMAAAETVGGKPEDVLEAACALELIHTYSLIHDDLPAMDNDDYRRGKPTNHKVFGEALAILAGDALLTKAFEVLTLTPVKDERVRSRLQQVIAEVAVAAGSQGMVGGQAVDILSEGKTIDAETLRYIHRNKTGALLRAAVRAGALLAGANAQSLAALTTYAEEFGLVFQITDDILNVVGDSKKLGKPVGTDAARAKATYPALFGLAEARRLAQEGADRALQALEGFGPQAEPLRQLVQFLLEREY